MTSPSDITQVSLICESRVYGDKLSKSSGGEFQLTGARSIHSPVIIDKHVCSTAIESFSLEDQEAEENFDLSLISSLEIDLVPHLGDPRVPDYLITQLANVLHQGSQLYKSSMNPSRPGSPSLDIAKASDVSGDSHDFEKVELDNGTTAPGVVVPRERFSFWCFDLLFLICSNVTSGNAISSCPLQS